MATRPVNLETQRQNSTSQTDSFPKEIRLDQPLLDLSKLGQSVNTNVITGSRSYTHLDGSSEKTISNSNLAEKMVKLDAAFKSIDVSTLNELLGDKEVIEDKKFLQMTLPLQFSIVLAKAANKGYAQIVQTLITKKIAQIDLKYLWSAYKEAFEIGHSEIATKLLKCSEFEDIPKQLVYDELLIAISEGNIKTVKTIMSSNILPVQDYLKYMINAFNRAVLVDNQDIANIIIKEIPDQSVHELFNDAFEKGDQKTVAIIVKGPKCPNHLLADMLLKAARKNYQEIQTAILQSVAFQGIYQGKVLIDAAKEGFEEIVKVIIASSEFGKILYILGEAFFAAVQNNRPNIVHIFLNCPEFKNINIAWAACSTEKAYEKGHKKLALDIFNKCEELLNDNDKDKLAQEIHLFFDKVCDDLENPEIAQTLIKSSIYKKMSPNTISWGLFCAAIKGNKPIVEAITSTEEFKKIPETDLKKAIEHTKDLQIKAIIEKAVNQNQSS